MKNNNIFTRSNRIFVVIFLVLQPLGSQTIAENSISTPSRGEVCKYTSNNDECMYVDKHCNSEFARKDGSCVEPAQLSGMGIGSSQSGSCDGNMALDDGRCIKSAPQCGDHLAFLDGTCIDLARVGGTYVIGGRVTEQKIAKPKPAGVGGLKPNGNYFMCTGPSSGMANIQGCVQTYFDADKKGVVCADKDGKYCSDSLLGLCYELAAGTGIKLNAWADGYRVKKGRTECLAECNSKANSMARFGGKCLGMLIPGE